MELGIATCESNITKTYQWWWVVRTVVRLTPSLFTAETTYNNKLTARLTIVSQATPFTERGKVWSHCT